MKRFRDLFWPTIGIVAVVASLWLLFRNFKGESIGPQIWMQLQSIPPGSYLLAVFSTFVAYGALAWYDRIALLHLNIRHISWTFVSICSFTTYAIGHNIGASVFSGGMVRYRAYTSKGLSAAEVTILVALCSITFALGTLLLGGIVLLFEPDSLSNLQGLLPPLLLQPSTARAIGIAFLALVGIYVAGSVLRLKPVTVMGFRLVYPHPGITFRQLVAAPLELLGAAGIIYFALPDGSPSFIIVLAVFLASFSAALVSNAPGGLGVFELVFIKAMPSVPQVKVLTALLVFRLLYLLIPLAFALLVVILFERSKLKALRTDAVGSSTAPALDAADGRGGQHTLP
jgi:uncharacterized membrane protein YbhN (UPF0104 family)